MSCGSETPKQTRRGITSANPEQRELSTPDMGTAPTPAKRRVGRGKDHAKQAFAERGGRCSRCKWAMTGKPGLYRHRYASGRGGFAALRTQERTRSPVLSEIRDSWPDQYREGGSSCKVEI